MSETFDIDAVLARLPKRSAAEDFAQMEAARQAALAAPPPEPSIIPFPEVRGGALDFACALGCGWAYRLDLAGWTLGPIAFRADDPDGMTRALTEQAERRGAEEHTEVETAIRDHFKTAHPGREIPTGGAR